MGRNYTGIIVEESLDDNRILNGLHINKIHISNSSDPADRWHLYEINNSKEEIQALSQHILEGWYMHFWAGTNITAVFRGRTFEFNYENKGTWADVLKYGLSLGIPEYQLDFPIKGL